MDAVKQIERHEHAIKLLLEIQECEKRIQSQTETISKVGQVGKQWFGDRIAVNKAIKNRLENYYNKSFKI